MKIHCAFLPLGLALLATPVAAADLHLDWNLRLRHESVDDAAFSHDAKADTARLRAAIRGALGKGWGFLIEGEGIASSGNDYNSGSNGRSAWPGITDPSGTEINQAWIGWHSAKFAATAGRQRLGWDNQRWLGSSSWRQNEQTFDALSLEAKLSETFSVRYAWLHRVHRVAGDSALDPLARERDLDSHFFNATWKRGKQQWTGYALLHHDQDVAAASTATYGLRWTGSEGAQWSWTAEAAQQRDYLDNPAAFHHSYWLLEPALQVHGLNWKLGWEHLGGNGQHALQTPLATLHPFEGWADKFNATPAGGLEDQWLSVAGKQEKFTWVLAWHDFHADIGSSHYGSEWDVSVSRPIGKSWNGMIKLADYQAESFARNTRKLWLQFEYTGSLPL
jgi:hypothetical protein